jgi:hypothetical protein
MMEKINQNTMQTNTTLPIAGSDSTKEFMTTCEKTMKRSNSISHSEVDEWTGDEC